MHTVTAYAHGNRNFDLRRSPAGSRRRPTDRVGRQSRSRELGRFLWGSSLPGKGTRPAAHLYCYLQSSHYLFCFTNTSRSKEHRSFLRRVAMAARFHGQQRPSLAIAHRRSDLKSFSRSRVLCSLSMDGPDGQGHRRRWHMCCSNACSSAGACSAGACETSLHHTGDYMQAVYIIWHRLQAAGPRLPPHQIMKQCSTCVSCALRYRSGTCLYAKIFLNQSLSTRHHTPHGHGQLL